MRVCDRRLLIHDIDAAGIAFTGRLVTIAIEVLEQGLGLAGIDVAAVLRERRWAAPLVHLEADFKRPLRHGDAIACDLVCETIGERSYTCRIDLTPAGAAEPAASVRVVAAVIDPVGFQAVAVPPGLRAALERLR
jgi:1,4-dihydroxy-2-naphthoyl-CoA hydrolase